MKTVKTKSGLTGWRAHLQANYKCFSEFESYSNIYGLHERLGFKTAEEAWDANPLLEGSVNPSDLRVVKTRKKTLTLGERVIMRDILNTILGDDDLMRGFRNACVVSRGELNRLHQKLTVEIHDQLGSVTIKGG